jgi:hypothetical protein
MPNDKIGLYRYLSSSFGNDVDTANVYDDEPLFKTIFPTFPVRGDRVQLREWMVKHFQNARDI